jgi:hypothetical protein
LNNAFAAPDTVRGRALRAETNREVDRSTDPTHPKLEGMMRLHAYIRRSLPRPRTRLLLCSAFRLLDGYETAK